MTGLLFLDIDDIVCLNRPYGAYDVMTTDVSAEVYEQLMHAPAVDVLLAALAEHRPRVVMTSSWIRFIDRERLADVFQLSGLGEVVDSLHDAWEAPQASRATRAQAIELWLSQHHAGERFAILDDDLSGTGLRGSAFDAAGRVVWCERDVGLLPAHLPLIRRALELSV
jgi:hypothetical protein